MTVVPNITENITVPMLHKIFTVVYHSFVLLESGIALPTEHTLHTTLAQVALNTIVVGGEDAEEPDTSK